MKSHPQYTAELRARGVRIFKDHRPDYASDNAAYHAVASKFGCFPDSRRVWFSRLSEMLANAMGLQGVTRGKKKTTIPDPAQACPEDKVNRQFTATAPEQFRVSDFTYVSVRAGMVYAAFVIDVFVGKIVGWRVSTSITTGFVLDALNQAICQRIPSQAVGLIHHSDRGSLYLSLQNTERLTQAGIDASVGSVGDNYDNALAESVIGLFKAEVIEFFGTWKTASQVEWETLNWCVGTTRPNRPECAKAANF